MTRRRTPRAVKVLRYVAPVCLVAAILPVAASATTPGPGTFTTVTTPKQDVHYQVKVGQANHLEVAGHTSADVTEVDIDCVTTIYNETADVQTLASSVPVTAGAFAVIGTLPLSSPVPCRLRAVPTGTDVEDGAYMSSYTGPLLSVEEFAPTQAGSKTYGYTALADEREGIAAVTDAATCGVEFLVPVNPVGPQVGPLELSCAFALAGANLASTASTIRVSGHNAYLPAAVHTFLTDSSPLTVTQPVLTASHKVAADGVVTVTESAPLMRCSGANTYPPTTTSCPQLITTGVRFARVITILASGEQISVRDTFTSTDHKAHSLSLEYLGNVEVETSNGTPTGRVGYIFPGHGPTFRAAAAGETIKRLGTKAGTMLARGDLYASTDDPDVYTLGETWSRAPSTVTFAGGSQDEFGMSYALSVPAGGRRSLGFAMSSRLATAAVTKLGVTAVHAMLPRITTAKGSGSSNGSSGSAKESGMIVAGANGLPVKVTVNGHPAKVTVKSATTEHFAVSFHLASTHRHISIVLTDGVGNKATYSG